MKKVLLGLCCTLVLTGCGGKTLTCTMSEKENGMEMKQKVALTFKDDKNVKGKMEVSIKIGDEGKEYLDLMKGMLDAAFEEYEEAGLKVDSKSKKNSLTISVKYDVDKLTDELKKDLDYSDTTYEETKKQLEDEGYTCK